MDWKNEYVKTRMRMLNVEGPVDAEDMDTSTMFVYCRKYGFFYVGKYNHHPFMAWLYAADKVGCDDKVGYDDDKVEDFIFDKFGSESDVADKFLEECPGACFRSSIGIGTKSSKILTYHEKDTFNPSELIQFGLDLEVV